MTTRLIEDDAPGTPVPPPVPFDPQVAPLVEALAATRRPTVRREDLRRVGVAEAARSNAAVIAGRAVGWEDRVVPGPSGAQDVEVTIFRPLGHDDEALPALYAIHGGGMVEGHRSWDAGPVVDLVDGLGVVGVTVEYRLAPEHPYPAGVEDCYAGLVWLAGSAASLRVDPARIVVMGGGAGGALAAVVALMARDRGGPALAGQMLFGPMLDNTDTTISRRQQAGLGVCTRDETLFAWRCVLGDDLATSEAAPAYAAPSRATDLAGLPPAFVEAGSAEPFRDESVGYVTRIWAVGGQAELHVWAGGCHLFDIHAPDAQITRAAGAACLSWLGRQLGV